MKAKLFSILLVIACCCYCAPALVQAQEQSPVVLQQTSGPMSSTGTVPGSSSLDSQGIRNYLLGPGDTLDIRVFGQPDFSWTGEVDSDGNIEPHFVETPIHALCRSEKDVRKDIIAAYGRYLKNPQVSVRIIGRNSRPPAIVYGAVRAPQRFQMQRRAHLNELLANAGGTTERANGKIQVLHTEAVMCPEPGDVPETIDAKNGVYPYSEYKISDLIAGKDEANPVIRPGDVITVLEAEPIYITGAVTSPQGLYLRDQLTLSRALAMVGGLRKEAKATDIHIYRQKPGAAQEIVRADFNAIRKNPKLDVLLQPYDVIEVRENGPFSGANILRTLTSGVLGIGPSVIQSFGATLPLRVLY
ncbi:MAG: polysaccharide biosynthesis/export protein [Blastocatellia bacterium]|nr:polysaccharide biosynthesis/export protein [Blastocatellia bacterium]